MSRRVLPLVAAGLAVALTACDNGSPGVVGPTLDAAHLDGTVGTSVAEQIYLSENLEDGTTAPGPDGSILYQVMLDDAAPAANLVELMALQGSCADNDASIDCDVMFDRIHIGATPDGATIYTLNRDVEGAGHPLGAYDVASGGFTYVGNVTGLPSSGNVLVAFSPTGVFYVGSEDTETIYEVDLTSMSVVNSWPVMYNGSELDLKGADIAFNDVGTMFLWTNADDVRGLYTVTLGATDATATRIALDDYYITGMAVRDGGTGDLLGSDNGQYSGSDQVLAFDQSSGALTAAYPFMLNGSPFNHSYGDMTTGFLGHEENGGCTYTQGYWKNHEDVWPDISPLDPNDFFGTGWSWMAIWDVAPGKADKTAGYPLTKDETKVAHQFMAAYLNYASTGAEPTSPTLDEVIAYFEGSNPVDSSTLNDWNNALTDFNEGLTGPGHCGD